MRKLIPVLLLLVFVLPGKTFGQNEKPTQIRFGVPKLTGQNVNPMEVFLLENEIANLLSNKFNAEIIRAEVITKKLNTLGYDNCDTDSCRLLLSAELKLNYLVESKIYKNSDKTYRLTINLYQQLTRFSFLFETEAKSFSQLKRALTTLSQMMMSIIIQETETQKRQAIGQRANELEIEKQEVTKEINKLEEEFNGTKQDINKLEKQIKHIQRRLASLIRRNPKLEETYNEVLKLYLPKDIKEDTENEKSN